MSKVFAGTSKTAGFVRDGNLYRMTGTEYLIARIYTFSFVLMPNDD